MIVIILRDHSVCVASHGGEGVGTHATFSGLYNGVPAIRSFVSCMQSQSIKIKASSSFSAVAAITLLDTRDLKLFLIHGHHMRGLSSLG